MTGPIEIINPGKDTAKALSLLLAEHNGHIPLGLSDLALPTPPTRALPRIALRRFLLRRGRGALSAFALPTPPTPRPASLYAVSFSGHQKRRGQRRAGGNRRVLFKRVLPSEYPIVPLRPFDGFPIVRGCVCWRGLD